MTQFSQYDLPIPTGEKLGKLLTGILMVLGIAGISYLLYTPFMGFLGGILSISQMLLKIAALLGVGIVSLLVTVALAPGVKNMIAISGYKFMDFWVDNYPEVQMEIWRDFLAKAKNETEDAQRTLMGIYQNIQNNIESISKKMEEVESAIGSDVLNNNERTEYELELAGFISERNEYQAVADELKDPIEIVGEFVEYKIKVLKAYDITIRTAKSKNSARKSLHKANQVLAKVFGDSVEKRNAIAAREVIVEKFGTELGELKGFKAQMSKLIKAGKTGDKIAIANARKYISSRMNVIEGSATVIHSVPVNAENKTRKHLS